MIILQSLRWLLLAAEVCVACPIVYLCIISISAVIDLAPVWWSAQM
jgi:hypothetical protein